MKRNYQSIRDYHLCELKGRVESRTFGGVRASILIEESNDINFLQTAGNAIVLTLDGSAQHLTRMESIRDETPTRSGEICLIPLGVELHLAWSNHERLQQSYMLEFDNALFETYAPEMMTDAFTKGHLVPANYATRPEIEALTRMIVREVDPDRGRGRVYAESAIRLLAIEIAGTAWSTRAVMPGEGGAHDPRVRRAIDYIESNFDSDISLLEISSAAGLSPTQLTGIFRRQIGTTPYSYVVNRRVARAVQLLRTTDMPIAHVALNAGFADQQHLTRVLRARHKHTPRQVRLAR